MQKAKSKVEETLDVLSRLEEGLAEAESRVIEIRRVLTALAREEGEKAKLEVVSLASQRGEEELVKARREAESEASEILSKSEEDLRVLKERIDSSLENAIQIVVAVVSGA